MRLIPALVLAFTMALPVHASPDAATLADIRAEVTQVRSQLAALRGELNASGAAGFEAAGGATAIDRMNAMEAQLMRLTNQTEQLQNRLNNISGDSERRLADLEFRLCELEPGCDLSALTVPQSSAGSSPQLAPSVPAVDGSATTASTVEEKTDFDAAIAVRDSGDYARAAEMFAHVAEAHAGGPLTAEALFLRGQALELAGDPRAAAAAWLEGFAAAPDGPRAAESLLGIAGVIEGQGDPTAACLYLAEIPARFPGSLSAAEAERQLVRLQCGAADLGVFDPLLDPRLDPEAAADQAAYQ